MSVPCYTNDFVRTLLVYYCPHQTPTLHTEIAKMTQTPRSPSSLAAENASVLDGKSVWACACDRRKGGRLLEGSIPAACLKATSF